MFPLSFPLSAANAAPPPFTTTPPVPYLAVVDPNHVLPRTYEWNAAVEQSLGKSDVLTLTYLGAAGRKLMRQDIYVAPNPDFTGEFDLMRNGATSSYQAMQAQFRHRLAHGLQTLLSYTWAHSIDDDSSDVYFVNVPPGDSPSSEERGPSNYDIRQSFAGAISYDIPGPGSGVWKSRLNTAGSESDTLPWGPGEVIGGTTAQPEEAPRSVDIRWHEQEQRYVASFTAHSPCLSCLQGSNSLGVKQIINASLLKRRALLQRIQTLHQHLVEICRLIAVARGCLIERTTQNPRQVQDSQNYRTRGTLCHCWC
jgi:hypothetical protein